ncbi:MAG: hypothetical protein ACFCGT_14610 [Sandaracinaceae bacterium]
MERGTSSRPSGEPHVGRHLRIGWWSLLLFAGVGLTLEALHAFKVGWYLDVASESRRLMLTLAHAHGVLLGLVHLGFAATLAIGAVRADRIRWASRSLLAASVLLPGGFLLGAIGIAGGDPGPGVALAPLGAIALFVGLVLTAGGLR